MKILIIGGTRFVGRHLVENARARGHLVTTFNRGQSNPDLFPDIERLYGDRAGDLSALMNRTWDAVIDTCGYLPRLVRLSCETLANKVQHYIFISTISVYADQSKPGLAEESPLADLADPTIEVVNGDTYGGLKALCEQAAEEVMPGRVLVIRPGLIVGHFDPTDRFTYWPVRVVRGGEILAPDSAAWQTQIIDVRDLAEWIIELVEVKKTGIFNAVGPAEPLTFGQLLDACIAASSSQAKLTWVSAEFLIDQGIQPWSDLPLWLPGDEYAGMDQVSMEKAIANGLKFRPLAETIRDTLAWEAERPPDHEWRAGLSSEKEAHVLSAWHAASLS